MNWEQTVALVTGGTRGIGKELVKQLTAKGATVIATGQSLQSISAAQKEMPAVRWIVLDQSNDEQINRFVQDAHDLNINLLINNAGVQQIRDFTLQDEALNFNTERETSINFIGPIKLTEGLLPTLQQRPNAKVVFVTSGLALAPKRSSPVYCATKAALRSFVKSLRAQMQFAGWPVSIVEALPPLVDTDMTRGRGSKKITAAAAAAQILSGIQANKKEIYVGASALLRVIMRISPKLGESIMINR